MMCPNCGGKTKVIDNVEVPDKSNNSTSIYRKRMCLDCKIFTYSVETKVEYDEQVRKLWNRYHRRTIANQKLMKELKYGV